MNAPDQPASDAAPAQRYADLTLSLGARLQIEFPGNGASARHVVTLIGHMPGESLMVRTPIANGITVPIAEGEPAVVRGFCGLSAFAFQTHVLRVCKAPYPYLHLAEPESVQRAPVRKARRVSVELPATVIKAGQENFEAKILDVSATGVQLECPRECGNMGSTVKVAFKVPTDQGEVPLEVEGEVRNLREAGEQQPAPGCRCGVNFKSLSREQSALLQNFVYRVTFERRGKAA